MTGIMGRLSPNKSKEATPLLGTPEKKVSTAAGETLVTKVWDEASLIQELSHRELSGKSADAVLGEVRLLVPSQSVGNIMIQSESSSRRYVPMLPADVEARPVVLLAPEQSSEQGSYASTITAIDCLVEKGVPPESITFINTESGRVGLEQLEAAHPKVRVVASTPSAVLGVQNYGSAAAAN